jgi:hypothetical protein
MFIGVQVIFSLYQGYLLSVISMHTSYVTYSDQVELVGYTYGFSFIR